MNLKPLDIRKQEFGKALVGGCNRDEVEGFLGMVADEVEKLLKEKAGLQDQVERLEASLKQYSELEQTLQDTLTTAQKAMDDARANAHQEAAMIVREGEARAKQLIAEAQKEAREIQEQIHRLGDMRNAFVVRQRSLLDAQVELVENLGRVPAPVGGEGSADTPRKDDPSADPNREEDGESEDTPPSSSIEG